MKKFFRILNVFIMAYALLVILKFSGLVSAYVLDHFHEGLIRLLNFN